MLSVVPAALMALVLVSHLYGRERQHFVVDSISTARAALQAVDRELASIKIAANVLSTSAFLQSGNLSGFYAQAMSVVQQGTGHHVVLSEATGRQLVNTLAPPGGPLPKHGNPAQLHEVFANGRPVLSDVYAGGTPHQPLISVDVPVFRRGKIVYDLSIAVQTSRFTRLLNDQHLPANWVGVVFDSKGIIAGRTRDAAQFVGKSGAPELVRRVAEAPEGSLETTAADGTRLLTVFSRSPETRWAVAIGIPAQELNGELGQSPWLFVVGAGLFIFASLGVVWLIGGRAARAQMERRPGKGS